MLTDKTTAARPPGLPVNDDSINRLVADLADLQARAALNLALEVGQLVVERVFDGDLACLRSKDPTKDVSLRKLASHPDLPFAKSTLFNAIGTDEVVERLGGVHTCGQLTASHYRTVLGLPHKAQEELLTEANEEGWSVRKLAEEASKLSSSKGGRPALSEAVKVLGALMSTYRAHEGVLASLDDLDGLKPDRAQKLLDAVTAMETRIATWKAKLQPLAVTPVECDVAKGRGKGKNKGKNKGKTSKGKKAKATP
jgi:hypothetical protein